MTEENRVPNFAEMTDEQIMNTDPTTLAVAESEEAPAENDPKALAEGSGEGGVPEEAGEGDPATPEEAGGADPSEGTDDPEPGDTDVAEKGEGTDTRDPHSDDEPNSPEGDQPSDKEDGDEPEGDPDSDAIDYKAAYEELLSPFRAARREVKVDNIKDARRLMQQGVDYSNKMRQMKPHLRVLRTLEKAGLTDPEQINFLIDLKEGKPDAIKKLLKDGSIDPMDLDLEGSESYKPTDHIMDDKEYTLTEVFDSISTSEKYQDTLKAIDGLDTVSKQQLQDNPSVIPVINQHIEAGIFETITAKVEMERMLGRLSGLSDLDAYYTVGEAMHKAGAFGTDPNAPSAPSESAQSPAQGNGSPAGKKPNAKAQKRAASPTKGRAAQAGKKVPDLSKMSDEEIMNVDLSTLL